MKHNDYIAELFKEKLSDFSPDVPSGAWEGIESQLDGINPSTSGASSAGASGSGLSLGAKIIIGSTLMVAAITGAWLMNSNSELPEANPASLSEAPSTKLSPEAKEPIADHGLISSERTEQPQENKVSAVPGENTDELVTAEKTESTENKITELPVQDASPDIEETIEAIENNEVPETLAAEEIIEIEKHIPKIIAQVDGNNAKAYTYYGTENLAQVKWQFGDGTQSTELSPSHTYASSGEYIVTLLGVTHNGESVMDKTKIVIEAEDISQVKKASSACFVDVPNIFTPNGDGLNDVLIIETKNVENANLLIYDVSGQLVYETTNLQHPWDGKNNRGETLNEGTYFYVVKCFDNAQNLHIDKGYISLRR